MKLVTLLALMLLSFQSQALEHGCQIMPQDIGKVASRMVGAFHQQKQSVPDSLVVAAEFEGEGGLDAMGIPERALYGTLEGFYRPLEDDYYSLIPIPVLGIALSRNRNMVYVCAHLDEDPAKTHVTVYMLRGYNLDPISIGTAIGDLTHSPQLQVRPLTADLIGISKVKKQFLFLLKWLPFMEIPFDATNGVQRLLANLLGDFTGIGVERLTMTLDSIEIASGVDLKNPRKARIQKRIPLNDLMPKPK